MFLPGCPDRVARIELPRCPKNVVVKKRSHRNSGQNGPVERSTALAGTIFVNIYEKTSFSQKRSHRNSGQNGPDERSTALTGTIFVNISVLVSRGNFQGAFRARCAGCPFARIGQKSICRDTFFCPDARIHLPGYCPDTIHQSVQEPYP